MSLEERAARLAKAVVSTAAVPYAVSVTQLQQDKVIALAARLVLDELKDYAASLNIRFE